MSLFIEWTDNLMLGLPEIDEQHLGMLKLLNRLAETVLPEYRGGEAGDDAATAETASMIQELLEELVARTYKHFQAEETLMSTFKYPGLIEHRNEHQLLCAELRVFVRDVSEGREQLDRKMLFDLKHWLLAHMLDSDKAFAEQIRRRESE